MRGVNQAIFALIMGYFAIIISAHAEGCDYAKITGEEVTFRTIFPEGEKYGYIMWGKKTEPGQVLDYKQYVGRKGKLQSEIIKGSLRFDEYKKVILENCEVVYGYLVKGELVGNSIYSIDDERRAKKLIGQKIWINQNAVLKSIKLVTLDRAVSYRLFHIEPLTVMGLHYPMIGHASGSGPFYLKLRNSESKEGYVPFNPKYLFFSYPIPKDTSPELVKVIRQQQIVLGMTAAQIALSWGTPERVNKSVGSWGVREQWVYDNQYVYITNGEVTSYQTQK